jgi:Flp pilus assembly protein protease CpaA
MPAIAVVPLAIWLGACVFHDLKTRQVPNILTLGALLLSAIWRAIAGDWLVVGLVIALIAISDLPRTLRILLAGAAWVACIVFGTAAQGNLSIALFAAWIFWEMGVMGGADAKMLTTLLLGVGDPWLLLVVLLAGPSLALGGAAALAVGALTSLVNTLALTEIQARTSEAHMGRMMSLAALR